MVCIGIPFTIDRKNQPIFLAEVFLISSHLSQITNNFSCLFLTCNEDEETHHAFIKCIFKSRCSLKDVLKNFAKFTGKHTYAKVSLLTKLLAQACTFIKKETLAQVFSSEFCEFFTNTFF